MSQNKLFAESLKCDVTFYKPLPRLLTDTAVLAETPPWVNRTQSARVYLHTTAFKSSILSKKMSSFLQLFSPEQWVIFCFILLQGSSSYLTSLEVVTFVRVHGLRCSKASAPYSEHCRSTAHIAGVRFHWSHEESDRGAFSASASGVEPGLY